MTSQEYSPALPEIPTKKCSKCGEKKPAPEFPLAGKRKNAAARKAHCKICEQIKRRQQYAANPVKKIAATRRWQQAHPAQINTTRNARNAVNPAPNRARVKAWRKANPEKRNKQDQARRKANPEEFRARLRRWNKAHPESTRNRVLRRRARRRNLPDTFTLEQQRFCRQYWQHACAICGHEEGFEWVLAFDHVVPLARQDCPGTVGTNMILMCHGKGPCNTAKNAKEIGTWLATRYSPQKAKAILQRIKAYFAIVREREIHKAS